MSADDAIRTVTVNGSAAQVATADRLVHQLDVPAKTPLTGMHEYRPPDPGDAVVRVFYATHVPAPQDLQEIAVAVRSVADIQRMFVYNTLHALVVRGPEKRVALAAWLVDQLKVRSVGEIMAAVFLYQPPRNSYAGHAGSHNQRIAPHLHLQCVGNSGRSRHHRIGRYRGKVLDEMKRNSR
ncbi:MAG TPA: hypothetical protein VKR61_10395 [Bryobacteraceae bacterium]|nr:hypothetical protein [Bryobacteraceae bacterium]